MILQIYSSVFDLSAKTRFDLYLHFSFFFCMRQSFSRQTNLWKSKICRKCMLPFLTWHRPSLSRADPQRFKTVPFWNNFIISTKSLIWTDLFTLPTHGSTKCKRDEVWGRTWRSGPTAEESAASRSSKFKTSNEHILDSRQLLSLSASRAAGWKAIGCK